MSFTCFYLEFDKSGKRPIDPKAAKAYDESMALLEKRDDESAMDKFRQCWNLSQRDHDQAIVAETIIALIMGMDHHGSAGQKTKKNKHRQSFFQNVGYYSIVCKHCHHISRITN
jgi:hypothetical protein